MLRGGGDPGKDPTTQERHPRSSLKMKQLRMKWGLGLGVEVVMKAESEVERGLWGRRKYEIGE